MLVADFCEDDMKRKNIIPEDDAPPAITIVRIAGELPVVWRNRHGFTVVERCYSSVSAQWTIAHRENVIALDTALFTGERWA